MSALVNELRAALRTRRCRRPLSGSYTDRLTPLLEASRCVLRRSEYPQQGVTQSAESLFGKLPGDAVTEAQKGRLALLSLLCVVLLFAGPTSCSEGTRTGSPEPSSSLTNLAIREASDLLDRYDLKPSGEWTSMQAKLQPFALVRAASSSIGLDVRGYGSRQVTLLTVQLQGHSQAWDGRERPAPSPAQTAQTDGQAESLRYRMGDIDACFVVDRDRVVGAYLALVGYFPGIVSLKDHYAFMPASLTPRHLDFTGLKSVEVIGPWTGDGWQESKLLSHNQSTTLLTLITASRLQEGERLGGPGDEEYAITFSYDDGARVAARLITQSASGKTSLVFDPAPFARFHYVPPDELKPFVQSLLGVR